MTAKKTVKAHLEESDRVEAIVKDANAMVKKLQAELATTRVVLEGLSDYQHPKLQMDVPYQIRLSDDKAMSPKAVINRQIDRINALLGDRA